MLLLLLLLLLLPLLLLLVLHDLAQKTLQKNKLFQHAIKYISHIFIMRMSVVTTTTITTTTASSSSSNSSSSLPVFYCELMQICWIPQ